MHHAGKTQRSQPGQGHAVLTLHILFQTLVAALQPLPDIFQTVSRSEERRVGKECL